MSSPTKRYPKLRFALITEDALDRLRPETKPQEQQQLVEVKDIYDTITNTVNVVVEQKLKQLKLDKLDQLIETKLLDFDRRQRRRQRAMPSVQTPESTPSEDGYYGVSEYGFRRDTRSPQKAFKKEPFATCYPYKATKTHKRKMSLANQ